MTVWHWVLSKIINFMRKVHKFLLKNSMPNWISKKKFNFWIFANLCKKCSKTLQGSHVIMTIIIGAVKQRNCQKHIRTLKFLTNIFIQSQKVFYTFEKWTFSNLCSPVFEQKYTKISILNAKYLPTKWR